MCTLCQGGEVRGLRDQGNAKKTLFYSALAGRSHLIPYGTCNHIDACTWGHAQLWAAAEFGRTTGGSAPALNACVRHAPPPPHESSGFAL